MNKKCKYFIVILLIVFSFIAFGRILGNDFTNFDDNIYITENNHIKAGLNSETIKWAFTTTYFSNWHPLTWLSYMLDWSLFGANASSHHLVSLLLHIGSIILLFLFLSKTTGSLWPSAFVAALFALHPLRVESVAWAAERKDVLSMFFGMATLYIYALYVEEQKLVRYFLCLTLFALGLMAKPMLVTLPFVLMLLDYWPLGRWQKVLNSQNNLVAVNNAISVKNKKKHKHNTPTEKKLSTSIQSRSQLISNLLWEKVPFILLAIASSITTIWAQHRDIASLDKMPFSDRIMNAIVSYVAYLGKTFWPVDLAVLYPYEHSFPMWQIFGAILILLGISAAVIYLIKKAPFLFVGWFWYLGTLIPVIGLVQVGIQSMADRYTYLPLIGIGIMLAWGIPFLIKREEIRKKILFPAGVVSIVILSFLTWEQCSYWKNSITLYERALKVTENNDLAHYNLGNALKDQGKMEEALTEYRETVRIKPSSADAHNNLGIILEMHFKKYDEAVYHYRQALQFDPNNSGTHFNFGIALAKKGELKEAIEHFRQAIYLKPDYEEARRALRLTMEIEQRRKH